MSPPPTEMDAQAAAALLLLRRWRDEDERMLAGLCPTPENVTQAGILARGVLGFLRWAGWRPEILGDVDRVPQDLDSVLVAMNGPALAPDSPPEQWLPHVVKVAYPGGKVRHLSHA